MASIKRKAVSLKQKAFWLHFLGCFMLCAFSFQLSKAQTFSEWFAQKSTQKKYLLAQIEALQQYGSFIKKGYEISQNGLGSIGDWIKGEFDLHGAYYNSLQTVNPEIKKDPKANECLQYAAAITKAFGGLQAPDEETANYIRSVSTKVLADTDADISELELVMTDGKAGLSDDERLKRISAIDERLKDRYVFTRHFCDQVRALLQQREQVLKDIETERRLYGY